MGPYRPCPGRRNFFSCLLLVVTILTASRSFGQAAHIEYSGEASPKTGGWFPWYQLASDPTNPNNLIACGSRWDAKDNAFYGFVYSTTDGGRSWRTALEDKNSTWVTEQSCAFGIRGEAYFVSEASSVIEGKPHHDVGTTRIFLSHDAGRVWTEAARSGWADYSASVVESQAGPYQNRLYTFYNDTYFVSSGAGNKLASGSTRISAVSFREDDAKVREPISFSKSRYQGSYPQQAFVLKDGSLLALYSASLKSKGRKYELIGAARSNHDLSEFSDTVLTRVPTQEMRGCYLSDFAATYDPSGDRLFVAYPKFDKGECRLILTVSLSSGKHWTTGRILPRPRTKSRTFFSPAMALGGDGMLGLLWRDEPVSDCWYFSASLDSGRRFGQPTPLARCSQQRTEYLTDFSASLRTDTSPVEHHLPTSALSVRMVDSRNHTWRNIGALTATSDGLFHAAWIETGQGKGELRTAAISIPQPSTASVPGVVDVTEDLSLLYGGDQYYDRDRNTVTVQITLKNHGRMALKSPLSLVALELDSGLGNLAVANSSNGIAEKGAAWDVSDTLPNGILEPGAATKPFPLIFSISQRVAPAGEVELFSLQLKAMSGVVGHPE
jgi:hypothetical protein